MRAHVEAARFYGHERGDSAFLVSDFTRGGHGAREVGHEEDDSAAHMSDFTRGGGAAREVGHASGHLVVLVSAFARGGHGARKCGHEEDLSVRLPPNERTGTQSAMNADGLLATGAICAALSHGTWRKQNAASPSGIM